MEILVLDLEQNWPYLFLECRKSSRINTTLAVNGLTPLLISRLDHQDAIARLNLLKLIKVSTTLSPVRICALFYFVYKSFDWFQILQYKFVSQGPLRLFIFLTPTVTKLLAVSFCHFLSKQTNMYSCVGHLRGTNCLVGNVRHVC